jgi:ABC-type molybdate transport system substrate-binding protein
MKKTGIIYLAAALFYLGIASFAFAGSKEITISAAMSLKNAFEENRICRLKTLLLF